MAKQDQPKLPPAFEPFVASETMRAYAGVERAVGGSLAQVAKNVQETVRAPEKSDLGRNMAALRSAMADVTAAQRASRELSDAITREHVRKARAEEAAIANAEATELLVEATSKQERALESMAKLLVQLVDGQRQLVEERGAAARTNRRWRWATITVAVIGAAAAVTAVILNIAG